MPDDSVDALAAPYLRKTNPEIPEEAMAAYDRARVAIYESDLVTGEKELKEVEKALQDADEVLANERALLAALKIWANH